MQRQCQTQSIFGDTVYSCSCIFRLVTPPWLGLRVRKFLILTTLDRWKRHFREQNYIENYFYLLKSTKSTKTTSQKCWRNIIWVDFFGRAYRSNGIKTLLGSPVKEGKILHRKHESYIFKLPLIKLSWLDKFYARKNFAIQGLFYKGKAKIRFFRKMAKKCWKRAKYLKICAKMYKIWKYFEKGQVIACYSCTQ